MKTPKHIGKYTAPNVISFQESLGPPFLFQKKRGSQAYPFQMLRRTMLRTERAMPINWLGVAFSLKKTME